VTSHPEVIFVGGTRFSGAEALAALLATRPGVSAVPSAVRLQTDPWGIPALLHGHIGLDDFAERVRVHEIAELVPRERLDAALAALRAGYHTDPLQSCRDLFWALIGEVAGEEGPGTLVEASPGNLVEAHTLTRLVPRARFVHVIRDGREVAAAAVESDEVDVGRLAAGLEWWAGELREIQRGLRGEEDGARYAIPSEQLAVVIVDELADSGASAVYRRLLESLSLREDEPVDDSARAVLHATAIDRGGWRTQVRGPGRWWVTRRYERTLDELAAEGNLAAPALRAAFDRYG
jgi:hypothetical protein